LAWLIRRDLFIGLLALGAGVGAALLVLGSDRERRPVGLGDAQNGCKPGRLHTRRGATP
jgi:hypothetical protein